ncbi:MAG: CHAT domain-containing protein [Planctomycetota bacterium]|nr:CHAT domain-containing protein [Planctomycetota bacterium]
MLFERVIGLEEQFAELATPPVRDVTPDSNWKDVVDTVRKWRLDSRLGHRKLLDITRLREEHLAERDRLWEATQNRWTEGQFEAAVEMGTEVLARDWQLFGELHDQPLSTLNWLASAELSRGHAGRAEETAFQRLADHEVLYGKQHWKTISARWFLDRVKKLGLVNVDVVRRMTQLQEEADRLKAAGELEQALVVAEELRDERAAAVGDEHPYYADALALVGKLQALLDRIADAESSLQRCVEVRRRTLGKEHPDTGFIVYQLGAIAAAMGDEEGAMEALEELKTTRLKWETAAGVAKPWWTEFENANQQKVTLLLKVAVQLSKREATIADLYRTAQAFPESSLKELLELLERQLSRSEDEPPKPYVYELLIPPNILIRTGVAIMLREGNTDAALTEAQEELQAREKSFGKEHWRVAEVLGSLADVHAARGEIDAAIQARQRQLSILTHLYDGDDHRVVDARQALDQLVSQPRPTESQRVALREVQANIRRALQLDAIGQHQAALKQFNEVIVAQQELLGEDHVEVAETLQMMAQRLDGLGLDETAMKFFARASDIRKRQQGEAHPDYVRLMVQMGGLFYGNGDYRHAEAYYIRAMALQKQTNRQWESEYADIMNNLGTLYGRVGHHFAAEGYLLQALKYRRARGNKEDIRVAIRNLGGFYHQRGLLQRAEPLMAESLAMSTGEDFRHTVSAVLNHNRVVRDSELDPLLSVHVELGIAPERMYREIILLKGKMLSLQPGTWNSRQGAEDADDVRRSIRTERVELARLVMTVAESGDSGPWFEKLQEIRLELGELERSFVFPRPGDNEAQLRTAPTVKAIQDALPDSVALVDFIRYTHCRPLLETPGEFLYELRFLAYIVRRGHPVDVVQLGSASLIEEAVNRWRKAMTSGRGADVVSAGQEVRKLVWLPLQAELSGIKTVLVSPDGVLNYLSFGALPGSRPDSWLLEEFGIARVNSAGDVVRIGRHDHPGTESGLLVIGEPRFPTSSKDRGLSSSFQLHPALRSHFQPLPGARFEMEMVAQIFSKSFPDDACSTLSEEKASIDQVRLELNKPPRFLHFATHGFYLSPTLLKALTGTSAEAADASPLRTNSDTREELFRGRPFLWSGISLAAEDRVQGILTAEEIRGFDLRGTEMVVLSACETALGDAYDSEGVMGLQNAFQQAGARTLVTSLWKVDDAATSVLMEHFYQNLWVDRLPKLEALRKAQIVVMKNPQLVEQRRHKLQAAGTRIPDFTNPVHVSPTTNDNRTTSPANWAGFVLAGDWR